MNTRVVISASETETLVLSGVVKWFSEERGYGFIVPDGGEGDALLHISRLRCVGHETAYEGARVDFEAVRFREGLRVMRILSIDNSTAVVPESSAPVMNHRLVVSVSERVPAMVIWFDRSIGYGFVALDNGTEDVFVHAETLHLYGMSTLKPGQPVTVRYGEGSKGLSVVEIYHRSE